MSQLPVKYKTTVNALYLVVVMWKIFVAFVMSQLETFTFWNFSFIHAENKIRSTAFQRMNLFWSSGTVQELIIY
jgi:hypothetical protein